MALPAKNGPSRRGGRRPTAPLRPSLRLAGIPAEAAADRPRDRPHSLPPIDRGQNRTSLKLTTDDICLSPKTPDTDPNRYPNSYEDPDPPSGSAAADKQEKQRRTVITFGDDMFEAFSSMNIEGEQLWTDFISTFRPHSIELWQKGLTYKWCTFLRSGDVHVDTGRDTPRVEALKRLLFRPAHIPSKPSAIVGKEGDPKRFSPHNYSYVTKPSQARQSKEMDASHMKDDQDGAPPWYTMPGRNDYVRYLTHDNPDSEEDSIGEKDQYNSHQSSGSTRKDQHAEGYEPSYYPKSTRRGDGLGIQALMKSCAGKKTFSGSWEEDLDSTISVFETMSSMCEVSDEEKLGAIPVMLSGEVLIYYSSNIQGCPNYADAITALQRWYDSSDKRERILTKWQSMRLTGELSKSPDASEVEVFRKFVSKLMSLQKQLDTSYHEDRFLRDRLMTAVAIPSIQVALRDRIPHTAQQLENRIANRLSELPRTAGSSLVHYTSSLEAPFSNEAMYTLGQSCGGAVRRPVKPCGNRGPSGIKRNERGSSSTGETSKPDRQRRLCPSWMRGVKDCFVCGENHLARQRHNREEISAAVERLKARPPQLFLPLKI